MTAYTLELSLRRLGEDEDLAIKTAIVHDTELSAGLYHLKLKIEEIKRDLLWQAAGGDKAKYHELMVRFEDAGRMTCEDCV